MDAKQITADFLSGRLDIAEYRRLFDEGQELEVFLQKIVDDIKASDGKIEPYPFLMDDGNVFMGTEGIPYLLAPETDPGLAYGLPPQYESVRQMLTYECRMITHNVRTAAGASTFFKQVLVLYWQIDKDIKPTNKYREAYDFALDVIPKYLAGGEAEIYIQEHIIPLFPETMKKAERQKAVKAKIKEEFHSEKGYPCWVQSSEWPLGKDGKPMTYLGKGKNSGGIYRWRFRDESTGEIVIVEQCL